MNGPTLAGTSYNIFACAPGTFKQIDKEQYIRLLYCKIAHSISHLKVVTVQSHAHSDSYLSCSIDSYSYNIMLRHNMMKRKERKNLIALRKIF